MPVPAPALPDNTITGADLSQQCPYQHRHYPATPLLAPSSFNYARTGIGIT
jgi:hypothetical protein